jgi:hypothetical protein
MPENAGLSKASRASVWCEVRKRYTEPLLTLYRPLLGASQTAFYASPKQAAGPIPRRLMINTDNTIVGAKLKDRKEEEKENDTVLCRATESGPPI